MHKFIVLPHKIIESRKAGTMLPVFHDIMSGDEHVCAELFGPVTLKQASDFARDPHSTWFETDGDVRPLKGKPNHSSKPHIIHVNRSHISMNKRDRTTIPVFTVKSPGMKARYGHRIEIDGPVLLIHSATPLSCGARAWIETFTPPKIHDEKTFGEARSETIHG
ncbi:hypothetical protein [Sulfitobacter sp. R18_1]|uniref:hypothetical protein n=1 Tax=Sulfitobacter sp. R18_1 TaxID=2821104 RepID=UPI001AD9A37E|nr:hypothetical protein [Sulfitobacter sp. R18_1]MBO9428369.1 hypothetical protein [Sulfitobacter sp. R18_1]